MNCCPLCITWLTRFLLINWFQFWLELLVNQRGDSFFFTLKNVLKRQTSNVKCCRGRFKWSMHINCTWLILIFDKWAVEKCFIRNRDVLLKFSILRSACDLDFIIHITYILKAFWTLTNDCVYRFNSPAFDNIFLGTIPNMRFQLNAIARENGHIVLEMKRNWNSAPLQDKRWK